jgi:hypothetical protein
VKKGAASALRYAMGVELQKYLLKEPWRASSARSSIYHVIRLYQIFKSVKYCSELVFSPLSFPIFSFFVSFIDHELCDFEKSIFKVIASLNEKPDRFVSRLISKLIRFLPK